jgi:F-type H+-transporting ATPase subunit epsilon
MEKLLDVEIVTPLKPVFKGTASSVSVPGELLPFQILYNHAPICSTLVPGVVSVVTNEGKRIFAVSKGFVTAQLNKVSIFVEKALSKEEIAREEVEKKLKEIKKQLEEAKDQKEKDELLFQLEELKAQLSAIEK